MWYRFDSCLSLTVDERAVITDGYRSSDIFDRVVEEIDLEIMVGLLMRCL